MEATGELAELLERFRELEPCGGEDLRGMVDLVRKLRLREAEREHEGCQPLLGAVVEIALEPSARRVGSRDDAAPRGAYLCLLLLPLRDVGARDENARVAPLVLDRRRRPRDGALSSFGGQPARLTLGLGHAVRRARDRHPRRELVLPRHEVEERGALEVHQRAAEGVEEGAVGAEGATTAS